MDERLISFKKEILKYQPDLSIEDWNAFESKLTPVLYKKGVSIFPATEVCKHVLFIEKGISAAEYIKKDESFIIRFFKTSGLCSNVSSLMSGALYNDRIFAITEVAGVLIPKQVFMKSYLEENGVGIYLRKRLLEVILEDKELTTIKTVSGVEAQLEFLQKNYPEVILEVPWKYIANFMGVTPEWLSRNLKRGKKNSR